MVKFGHRDNCVFTKKKKIFSEMCSLIYYIGTGKLESIPHKHDYGLICLFEFSNYPGQARGWPNVLKLKDDLSSS